MRGHRRMRRATLTCVWSLILATAGTSFAIAQNTGPDGLVWFPWIITGWVLMGVWGTAAIGCGVVWLINTVRIELQRTIAAHSLDGPTVQREEMEASVRRAYWNGRRAAVGVAVPRPAEPDPGNAGADHQG